MRFQASVVRGECVPSRGLFDAFPTPLSPLSTPSQTLILRPIERGRIPWRTRAVSSSNRHVSKTGRAREKSIFAARGGEVEQSLDLLSSLDVDVPSFLTRFECPFAPSQTLRSPPIDRARSLKRIGTDWGVNRRLEYLLLREHLASHRQAKDETEAFSPACTLSRKGRNIAKRLYLTRRYAQTMAT